MLVKLLSGSSRAGNAVLLVGLAESGKTVLFTKLLTGKFVQTLTSMQPNESDLLVGKRSLQLCDLPGHERLRSKLWSDYSGRARGVVFVVDSSQFLANIRDVADFLYTVLADSGVNKRKVPVLVACNKQDEPKAKSAKVIQSQLEKELNNIRATRSAALGSTDGSSENVLLGNPARDFRYSDLRVPIEFVDANSSDEKGLDEVLKWISKL